MTEITRGEKVQFNKGVAVYIDELINTSTDETRLSAQGVLALIKDEYPHADIKTVSNALTNLHRRNAITKHPSCKGIHGALWGPILKEIKPKPERQFNAKQVGEAVITALINMKKRIKEQDERVDRLLNTLSNREASWKTKEADFRSRIVDQNKIIASLQAQLEPDPDLMFKLSEVANFTGEQDGKT